MASRFRVGTWVKVKGEGFRGLVTGHRGRSNVLIRWAGSQKAEARLTGSLSACSPPRALVLEGALDKALESTRSGEDLLRTWLGANRIPVAYKNILTLQDLAVVGRSLGEHIPPFVHISCHGNYDGRRPYIVLAPYSRKSDRIYLDDPATIAVFRQAFEGLPLLFSACLLGKHQRAMQAFCKAASVPVVAAFTRSVFDSEAMLFELMLYQGVLLNGWTFRRAVETACAAMEKLAVRGGAGKAQRFVRIFLPR